MTFKEEIAKLAIDKILLGSIIGLAIYYGTIQLEEIKADESLKSELNKMRIVKIAEVWEKAADFEMDFYKLYHEVESEKVSMIIDNEKITEEEIYKREKIKPYIKLVGESRAEFLMVIHKNSFYLGDILKDQVFEFHRSLAFVDLYQKISLNKEIGKQSDSISIKDAKSKVDHFRANISQIRDYIIAGGR